MDFGIIMAILIPGLLFIGVFVGIIKEQKALENQVNVGEYDERQVMERYRIGFISFFSLFILCGIFCSLCYFSSFIQKNLPWFIAGSMVFTITLYAVLLMVNGAYFKPGVKNEAFIPFFFGPGIVLVGMIIREAKHSSIVAPIVIFYMLLLLSLITLTIAQAIAVKKYKEGLEQEELEKIQGHPEE